MALCDALRITTDHCPLSTTQYFLSPRHENNGTLDRASVNEGLCEHGCSVTECKIIMGKTFILSVCDDRSRQYRPGTHCRGSKKPEFRANQPLKAALNGCGGGGSGTVRGNARRMPRHESVFTHDRANGMSDYANRERRHSAAGCRATRVCLRTTERMK